MLRKVAAGFLCTLVLGTAACQGDNDAGDADFPLRVPAASPTTSSGPVIGLVGSMSGPDAWRGEDAFEGVDVAVQVLNRNGRSSEQPFTLVGLDDEGDPERATELVEELAESNRTVGIVYAGPPEGLASAEPALAEAGIPAMLVYGDLYSPRLLRAHLFQAAPPFLWQARRLAGYLLDDRRYRRIGILAEDSFGGKAATEATRAALDQAGRRAAAVVAYPESDDDFSDELDRLRTKQVEAIVFHGPARGARRLFEELDSMSASYISTSRARTVTATRRERRRNRGEWHPQIAAFDGIISPLTGTADEIPAGTVAADSYARGAHYLPVPEFRRFRQDFVAWWDDEPTGWQRRAYEATLAIGHAARMAPPGEDVAGILERLSGERFGGIEVTLGPDDHTTMEQTTIGLWVVPARDAYVRERNELPDEMPWVMLARGFSIDGTRTNVLPADWEYLFRGTYRPSGPAPRVSQARFGVASPRRDPVH